MLFLKEVLDKSFRRSFLVLTTFFVFAFFSLIIFLCFLNAKEILEKNILTSTSIVTNLLYSKNLPRITDYFNSLGDMGVITFSQVTEIQTGVKIFEGMYSENIFTPNMCRIYHSEIVSINLCVPLISNLAFQLLIAVSMCLFLFISMVYQKLRKNSLSVFGAISEDLLKFDEPTKTSIHEISKVKFEIEKKSNEIIELRTASAFANLSRQVAHDIRSPLAVLNNLITPNDTSADTVLLKSSINKLNEIANSLLKPSANASFTLKNYTRFSIQECLQTIKDLKIAEYKQLKLLIEIECSSEHLLWFHRNSFERVISNCINNSIEASENLYQIIISVKALNGLTTVTIEDCGKGFSDDLLKAFSCDLDFFTDKKNGNGLALNYAKKVLIECGGSIFISNNSRGAKVELNFPAACFIESTDPIVLIDDDKYIHQSWILAGKKRGITVWTYFSVEEFLSNRFDIPLSAEIFIDSELGEMKGENYIPKIQGFGFKRINMETGKSFNDISYLDGVNSVGGKSFPYL